MSEGEKRMHTTLLKTKAFPAILLILMVLAVLPMQLRSATVLPMQFESTSPNSITISVDPESANVGDNVVVSGSGATPEEKVRIYWDEVDDWDEDDHTGYLEETAAESDGDFEVEIIVPEQTGGDAVHEIIAFDTKTEGTARVEFTIKPKVVVSPDVGMPGDTVEVEGAGFTKDADVYIYFDEDRDWKKHPKEDMELVVTTKTDDFGSFAPEEFDVPDVDEGHYNVWAIDKEGYSAKDVFTVTAVVTKPAITLDPTEGRPGDEITIEGWGFTGDSDITLTFDRIDVTPAGGIETDNEGHFEDEFVVPDVPADEYKVKAKDEKKLSAEANFEVVVPVVPAAIPTGLEELEEEISELLDDAFKNSRAAKGHRTALCNKIEAVINQVEAEAYKGAINKLEHDIKDKIEKWIVEDEAEDLIDGVEDIIDTLQELI